MKTMDWRVYALIIILAVLASLTFLAWKGIVSGTVVAAAVTTVLVWLAPSAKDMLTPHVPTDEKNTDPATPAAKKKAAATITD